MKRNNIYIVAMLAIAILFSNCAKDEKFIKVAGPGESSVQLKINEIFSKSETEPDWLEIYNPGDAEVDMTGFGIYDKVDAKFTWPAGTVISSKSHIILICDKDMAVDDPGNVANFKLSSGGESVTLLDKEGKIIDDVDFPALDLNTTWSRIPDGTDNWEVANPTKGTANSNENNPPIIIADTITNVNDNVRYTYEITATDPSGLSSVKLFWKNSIETNFVSMAPLGGGKYTYTFPKLDAGEEVEYYVEATDVTNLKSYFAGTSPDDNLSFVVADGLPIFKEVKYTPELPSDGDSVLFEVKAYDKNGIDRIRVYYLINETDAANKNKITLVYDASDDYYKGYVPAQSVNDVVSYYLRAEDNNGNKSYYPEEIVGGNFNHDDGTTWPTYTYKSYDPVTETVVNYTGGPLTKVTFPANPTPANANIVMEYDATVDGAILEARIYFDVRETPAYVKANKVKGEDDASFTQTGVTVNLANIDAEDEAGLYSGNTSISGTKVTFYIRIATANAEYYYGSDGSMYLDNTPGGGTTDQSDMFKGDTSLWNSYTVQ